MEQRNEETKRSCLGMSANKSSILGSVRSSKDFCHQFWRLLRKNSMLHVRGCTTCILSYSIFHFYFVWNFNFWHWWRMLNYSFIFTGRYHGKSNNKTHSRKKNTVRIETLHEPLALEQLTFVDDYLLLSSLDCSINPWIRSRHKTAS